ncbi:AfsR/SARP family transcriptional regulator [Nocardioides taihuensis]|uniref:BTAD domain-containing putative transcriptional regulator n=1 Tax=Nocardioides taihuensis TaxID=1835606 RepID=A0ABW0BDH6_9ACTN
MPARRETGRAPLSVTAPAGARLRLLDTFTLEASGTTVDLPEGQQRLLAYLAQHGPSARAVVAGTLWPEATEGHALANLRTGVWRLNRLLPGLLCVDGFRLGVSPDLWVDSRQQEALATRLLHHEPGDEPWAGDEVSTLWQREFLPGWYDDWIIFERERLGQMRLHALEHAARLLILRRDLNAALRFALEAVRTEPLRETATVVLVSVYLAEGNVADAVHQRDVFTEHLWRELGVEPSPRLASLVPWPRRSSPTSVMPT